MHYHSVRHAFPPVLFGSAPFLTLSFNLGREGQSTGVLAVLWFRSGDIACCFHSCTLDLHMQEKVECVKHHNQLRVLPIWNKVGWGSVSFRARVLKPLSLQWEVCSVWMGGCVSVCMLCMCDCACVLFILVGEDWTWTLLFILECDVSSHTWGRGEGAVTDCSSCLKLCTKLSDQTSCCDLKKVHCFLVSPLSLFWWNVTLWWAFWCEQMFSRTKT